MVDVSPKLEGGMLRNACHEACGMNSLKPLSPSSLSEQDENVSENITENSRKDGKVKAGWQAKGSQQYTESDSFRAGTGESGKSVLAEKKTVLRTLNTNTVQSCPNTPLASIGGMAHQALAPSLAPTQGLGRFTNPEEIFSLTVGFESMQSPREAVCREGRNKPSTASPFAAQRAGSMTSPRASTRFAFSQRLNDRSEFLQRAEECGGEEPLVVSPSNWDTCETFKYHKRSNSERLGERYPRRGLEHKGSPLASSPLVAFPYPEHILGIRRNTFSSTQHDTSQPRPVCKVSDFVPPVTPRSALKRGENQDRFSNKVKHEPKQGSVRPTSTTGHKPLRPFQAGGGGFGRTRKAFAPPSIMTNVSAAGAERSSSEPDEQTMHQGGASSSQVTSGANLELDTTNRVTLSSSTTPAASSEHAHSASYSPQEGHPGSETATFLSLKRRRPRLKMKLEIDTLGSLSSEKPSQDMPQTPCKWKNEWAKNKERHNSPPSSQVLDFLHIGGATALVKDPNYAKDMGFTAFINASRMTVTLPTGSSELELHLRDKSSEDISCVFYAIVNFIERARKADEKVLVFCHRGISRSATLVIAYLIWRNKCTYNDALAYVKKRRPAIDPNIGFSLQLMMWATKRPSVCKDSSTFLYRLEHGDKKFFVSRSPVLAEQHVTLMFRPSSGIKATLEQNVRNENGGQSRPTGKPASLLNGAEVSPGTSCWLLVSIDQDCQYLWYAPGESSSQLISDSSTTAQELVMLEGAPSTVIKVPQGSEDSKFWSALASALEAQ
mmetsp:Transcript_12283/g.21918  ORF Transcript_12283/g.21918 Transcript_12283/m.21918 type:complete len:778 (-) Transcript_12283:53-2386(-)